MSTKKNGFGMQDYLLTLSIFFASHLVSTYVLVDSPNTKVVSWSNGKEATFNTFFAGENAFYPFYLDQHKDTTCRTLHAIGTSIVLLISIVEINVLKSLVLAVIVGLSVNQVTPMISNGFLEFGLMGFAYVYFMKKNTGNYKLAALVPFIAYFFAWLGHFKFEQNKPATFMYPSFSLMGDFVMFRDYVMELVQEYK
jgi:hypothetical protein